MRSRFYTLLFFTLVLPSSNCFATSKHFGDEVVECVSKIHPPLDSPYLPQLFDECEKQIAAKKIADQAAAFAIAFTNCLKVKTLELDDNISPASEVASALLIQCEALVNTYRKNTSPKNAEWPVYPSKTDTEIAISTVLEVRAEKRNSTANNSVNNKSNKQNTY